MNAQLTSVAEGGNTGQRLTISNSSNHGDIGDKAVNLSFSGSSSLTNGATGEYSISMGRRTIASGINSTSMGTYTTASADASTAMGRGTVASGNYSTAMGYSTSATGKYSTAMGNASTASGTSSLAIGLSSTASDSHSLAIGRSTTSSGSHSVAMGFGTTASGNRSTATGAYTTASDFGSTVIGQYNSSGSSVTNNAFSFNTANTAFVIGNGTDSSNKSDAFKVMFNGDATIGNDLTVSGDGVVSSDARLKSNIVSLGSTLSRLLLIDGKSCEMKGKQKIVVLAQEIKEVFPELVTEDSNEMLAVNYQGLVPVLINALKEQDAEMKEQEKRLERLEAIISKMDK
jgi:hypothetical protein